MIIDTPPPPSSSVKPKPPVHAISDKTWVPLGVLAAVVVAAVSIHGAWRSTEGRVDLQAVALQATQREVEELRRSAREASVSNAQRDMVQLGLQRDVAEIRAGVQRLEEAIAPTQGRRR